MTFEFETTWPGTELGAYRHCGGTYDFYPYQSVPILDAARFTGDFEWLPVHGAFDPGKAALLADLDRQLAAQASPCHETSFATIPTLRCPKRWKQCRGLVAIRLYRSSPSPARWNRERSWSGSLTTNKTVSPGICICANPVKPLWCMPMASNSRLTMKGRRPISDLACFRRILLHATLRISARSSGVHHRSSSSPTAFGSKIESYEP